MAADPTPQELRVPDSKLFEDRNVRELHDYFVSTARDIGVAVVTDAGLCPANRCATNCRIDDHLVGLDYSDYSTPLLPLAPYRLLLRLQHTHAFEAFRNVGSIPQQSFTNWDVYRKLRASPQSYRASGNAICCRFRPGTDREGLRRRRAKAVSLLCDSFGSRVATDLLPRAKFWRTALGSLVAVHVPGSHMHIMDRSVQQFMALGVCTITTMPMSTCCEIRPIPWEHYIPLRDDMADIVEQVRWVEQHREAAVRIGRQAQRFFELHSLPAAIWHYIGTRLQNPELPRNDGCDVGSYLR